MLSGCDHLQFFSMYLWAYLVTSFHYGEANYLIYHGDRKQKSGYQEPGVGEEENGRLLFDRYRISVWDDDRVLQRDSDDDCITM